MDKEDWYSIIARLVVIIVFIAVSVAWIRVFMWYLSAQVGG